MTGVEDVIERFMAGDADAVREIYRRHGRAVFSVARAMTGDPDLAADVVQQTFIKAWKAAATFDGRRDLAPWLYTIARRTAIDTMRTERRPTQGGHAPETDAAVEPVSFERTWETFEVRRAVDALSDGERQAVELSHRIGLTHEQIAAQLGVPIGTVKSRLHRAHRRLAAALGYLRDDAENSDGNENQADVRDVEEVEEGEA